MTREEAVRRLEEDLDIIENGGKMVEVFVFKRVGAPYPSEDGRRYMLGTRWVQDFRVGTMMYWWQEGRICARCGAKIRPCDLVVAVQEMGQETIHRDCLDSIERKTMEQYLEGKV